MKEIYLDNSATTSLSEPVKEAMREAMEIYGNPSSLHSAGLAAEKILKEARKNIAEALGIRVFKENQLIFTSSGSEASNLAIFGTAYAKETRRANKIITTDSEHPSVENPISRLEKEGFKVVRISTKGGVLDLNQLEKECEGVLLASFMMVNNETGAVYDVKKAFSMIKAKSPDAVTHCDAVQGFLKEKFTATGICADLITISAHKIHGPKGVGALYIAPDMLKKKKIVPFILGGGQEFGMRSGTENTVGIAGFGRAARSGYASLPSSSEHMREIRELITERLPSEIRVNIPCGNFAPHILNITLPDIKSETMLHFLSSKGIYVSSGSACSSHSLKPSSTLVAFGLTPKEADCSLRISLSSENTAEDADALCNALAEGLSTLVRIK
ncbi:MAG: cysteine desulfurase family protein [Clostridia bacterium]|nr:cysteine desulfurase family protein [Clostridia bacterium]